MAIQKKLQGQKYYLSGPGVEYTPKKMKVWKFGRCFSFSQGWFSGSMLVFQGVTTESTDILFRIFFWSEKEDPK